MDKEATPANEDDIKAAMRGYWEECARWPGNFGAIDPEAYDDV